MGLAAPLLAAMISSTNKGTPMSYTNEMGYTYDPETDDFFSKVHWEPGERQGIRVGLTTEEKFLKLFHHIEYLESRIEQLENS